MRIHSPAYLLSAYKKDADRSKPLRIFMVLGTSIPFDRLKESYFMTFGKVSTLASETHWVTAASYAAFCASVSISS